MIAAGLHGPLRLGRCERDLGTPPLLLILKREKIMVDNDKALELRARRAVRRYWMSVLRWDPLGRLRRSCASDPRRRYEYEAVFQAQVELVTGMLAIDFEIEKEGMTVPYPRAQSWALWIFADVQISQSKSRRVRAKIAVL